MNKAELVQQLEVRLGGKKAANEALNLVLETIERAVAKGEKVSITGFGTFEKQVRPARKGRNPRTGEAVRIKRTSVPKFRPGATFKGYVQDPRTLPKPEKPAAKATVKATAKSPAKSTKSAKPATQKATKAAATAKASAAKTKKTATRTATKAKSAVAKKAAPARSAAKKAVAKKPATRKTTAKRPAPKKTTARRK